ncbi:uncharacterized protein CDV56_108553 [Aspergillus thermomutatus]|uniref:Uncharacterized protein n=1 Tax=Aspergillus thermomutatus TaxID=41047 RepID=A0A397HED8_ASPTH|nr:uncharacterized protein CDV56_108553 [Aspergillus thermomutatus]RHZ61347.1 hypothetical protein CDV56_108553 [Aspergillus thermomutatus]
MSDDEWLDEYDDEDVLWIEEPDPTIADDLAEAATYDVLYFDDPSLDVEDVYSDWDELSDDYYDDDSTVEKRRRLLNLVKNTGYAGEIPEDIQRQGLQQQKTLVHRLHRGGAVAESPASKTDHASFQAVVWKSSDDEKDTVTLYEPGDGEKVALLKNWREVFRNSHPANDRLRLRKLGHLKVDKEHSRSRLIGALLQRESQKEDSSDCTSGVSSLENLRETDAASENSLTSTPPESVSSTPLHRINAMEAITGVPVVPEFNDLKCPPEDSEMDDITTKRVEAEPTDSAGNGSSLSSGKHRKRKASDLAEDHPDTSMDASKRSKSESKVLNTAGKKGIAATASSGPVRRSTRQKTNQK